MSITEPFDFFIQWHLTGRCNLHCKHCYQKGLPGQELALSEIKEVIGEVSDMLGDWAEAYGIAFSPSFTITGGEPLLRKDLFKVLEMIKKSGFDIYILSNGTLIDKNKAKMLSDIGVKGVQVSMEGPEKIHDIIRGKASYSSALRGVRNLLTQGIKVTLNITLSDINADCFMDMVKLSKSTGVQRLGFSRLVPYGRGAHMISNMLNKEKVKELYETISSLNMKGLEIVTGDPIFAQRSSNSRAGGFIPVGGCAAGLSGMTILQDGTITPCRRLPIPIGNVRKDSLRELWVTSEVLMKLRDKKSYRGKCGSCERWASCRGCRAIAYAYSCSKGKNNFLSEDPQCCIEV